ncbi:hypothetical protein [Microseira sp. BLCC-F43]
MQRDKWSILTREPIGFMWSIKQVIYEGVGEEIAVKLYKELNTDIYEE